MKPRKFLALVICLALPGRLPVAASDDANLPDSKLSRSKVIAPDKATGETIWETARPYNRGAWSTPMIWRHERGPDLVVLGNGRVYGDEPATGAKKWYVSGFAREPIAVPVAGDGQLNVSVSMQGGRGDVQLDPEPFWTALLPLDRNEDGRIGRDENRDGFWTKEEFITDLTVGQGRPSVAAIRPGSTGDITATHVSWNLGSGIPEIPSPIFHSGRLHLVRDGGILSCVNTATGEVVYRERLRADGQYMASPVIANDRLYLLSSKGVLTVVRTGGKFEIVHQADLKASVAATPAMSTNSLFVRTDKAILAFR